MVQQMRELQIPDGIESDENATEMIRFWLANGEPHLTLLLGMYEDAEDCEVDELFARGNILSDIAQHVAKGMEKRHGWDYTESVKGIAAHFQEAVRERAPGLEGDYPETA